MVGTDVPKQSLYENDRRELRGDLLARLSANGVDIHYALTAERREGAPLGEDAIGRVSLSWRPSASSRIDGIRVSDHIGRRSGQKAMTFGKRLAEERKRLGLKQAEFAAMVGTDVPKQSLYENDRRELRGDLLARLAANGVDIHYVLTAERSEGSPLGEDATGMVSAFLGLPPELRESVLRLLRDLNEHLG